MPIWPPMKPRSTLKCPSAPDFGSRCTRGSITVSPRPCIARPASIAARISSSASAAASTSGRLRYVRQRSGMTGGGGVAGDGEGDDERHVKRVDGKHREDDGQRSATDVVLDEREADHPGRDDVGEQRPPEDEKEPVPGERPQPGRQVATGEQ